MLTSGKSYRCPIIPDGQRHHREWICKRPSFKKTLEEPGLSVIQVYFLQRKEMNVSWWPGRLEGVSDNLVIFFAILWSLPS